MILKRNLIRFKQPSERLQNILLEQDKMVDEKEEGGIPDNKGKNEKEEGFVSAPKAAKTTNNFPQTVKGDETRSV